MPATYPTPLMSRRNRARVTNMDELPLVELDHSREFTSAFENAAIGMSVVTPDSRRVRVNKAFCDMLGYSEAEMMLLNTDHITHPDEHALNWHDRQLCLSGIKHTFQREKRYLRKDGSIVWGQLTSTLVRDDDNRPLHFVSQIVDITRQKLAQEQLQAAQSLLHMAAQLGRLGAFSSTAGTDKVVWSNEVCAIFEVKPGFEPTREQALQFLSPHDRGDMRERLRQCVRDGTPFDAEAQVVTARGRALWVRVLCEAEWDESGQVQRILGAVQDITDARQAAERALHVAEQHTMTLESLTDAFLTLDRSLVFTYMNGPAEQMMQRPRGELLGRNIFDVLPDLRGSDVQGHMERALRDNEAVQYEREYPPLQLHVHVKIYPSAQGLALFVRDITQRVAAEREVLRLNAELEQRVRERTAQLEAVNRDLEAFSYSIAHDLRAPLSSIDGFSKVLEESAALLPGRGAHYLKRIRASVRHMGELTDGLLALANLARTPLRDDDVDLSEMARAAVAALRERSPQRVVRISVAAGMRGRGDARLLSQVMGNLVGNAWKFTSRQGDAQIEIGAHKQDDGTPVFFVRDNGAGFDMEYAHRLFEAFHRLHSAEEFEGTGIGLAIVHKIVLRHGGRIWAEGAPQQGATFSFTLGA